MVLKLDPKMKVIFVCWYWLLISYNQKVSTTNATKKEVSLIGGERWKVIGLFSVCKRKKNTSNSLFHQQSVIYNQTSHFLYGKHYDRNTIWKKMGNKAWKDYDLNWPFDYISFDICSFQDVIKTVVELLLNDRFYVTNKLQNPPLFNNHTIENWEQQTNIIFIEAYLPVDSIKLLAETTLSLHVPILILNPIDRNMLPNFQHVHYKLPAVTRAQDIHSHLSYTFMTASVILILIKENYFTIQEELYDLLIHSLKKYHNCVTIVSVRSGNMSAYLDTLNLLKHDKKNEMVVVFGNEIEQGAFLKMSTQKKIDGRTWIYVNSLRLGEKNYLLPNTTVYSIWSHNTWICSHFNKHLQLYPQFLLNSSNSHTTKINLDAICQAEAAFNRYHNFLKTKKNIAYKHFSNSFFQLAFSSITSILQLVSHNNTTEITHKSRSEIKKYEIHYCRIYKCQPGWERTYGKLLQHHTIWKTSYGWTCKKCAKNYFKKTYGDGPCQKCVGYNVSNDDRTSCYDPYVLNVLNIEMSSVRFSLTLSIIGMVIHKIMLLVLMWYRNTPVVLSGDIHFTIIHIAVSVVIDWFLPFLFLGKPSYTLCLCRPLVISILFTVNLAIVAIKSYKMIQAFSSQVVLTKTEIITTTIIQWFVIVVMVILGSLLYVVTEMAIPAKVYEKLHPNFVKGVYCNTGFHIQCQIGYFIILLIFCSIQAFRARNLPIIYNESITIAYMSFTLTIIFTIVSLLYNFQKVKDQSVLHWIGLSTYNILMVLIMYSNRIYIILFHPEKNSRKYIKKKLFARYNGNIS